MVEELKTVDAVLDALGGTRAVAELFGRTDPAISNWRKAEQFPAYTYPVIRNELQKIDRCAPEALWAWAVKQTADEVAS